MSLSPETRARIESILAANHVVLFMKGEPRAPQCGFSAKAVGILGGLLPSFGHVDVLSDPEIREGIKVYGQWPTIPQLYVGGELLGGSDIIEQMLNSGELHEALGLAAPDRTPPRIEITPAAAEAIQRAMDGADDGAQRAADSAKSVGETVPQSLSGLILRPQMRPYFLIKPL